jgi:hypothetical protein
MGTPDIHPFPFPEILIGSILCFFSEYFHAFGMYPASIDVEAAVHNLHGKGKLNEKILISAKLVHEYFNNSQGDIFAFVFISPFL